MNDSPRDAHDSPPSSMAMQDNVDSSPIPSLQTDQPQVVTTTWKYVLLLAWPVLAQQFLVLLVGLSDSFLAGNYRAITPKQEAEALGHRLAGLGQIGTTTSTGNLSGLVSSSSFQSAEQIMSRQIAFQSAQTTAMYLSWFLSSATVLVTVGSTALVARSIGAKDNERAVHFTNQSILLGAVLGITGTVLGLLYVDDLIWLLQLRGQSARFAIEYLTPMFILLAFQVVELAGIACLVGAGDTKTGLWVMTAVAVLNVPLSWGLCLGLGPLPEIGFVGIAWGTAISHLLGGVAVLCLLIRGRFGLRLHAPLLGPDLHLIRRLLRVSVPAGVDSMSLLFGQFWYLTIVNQLGDVASSAHGVAIRWEALAFLSGIAFGTAAMTLVGQNLGAERPTEAARSGWIAFLMGCGIMTVMGTIFYILARPMFLLFFPHPWQQASVEVGIPVLRLVAFAMPALAASIILTHALRGAGDTTVPVIFTWTGFLLVRIPLAYWFALPEVHVPFYGGIEGWDLGLFGAWLAMFADLILRGLLVTWRFASGAWKRIKV